ncbi:hypothetical protein BJF89_16930 [Corynebacterium sp. CNJ-954]|uniref:class I SAM-dependent methyltransferase n=1 Tax=Corynebacterium sp. CNJ-954 TaxID=1904962 RepID=UPI0009610E71|nr:class I SAM-dependent methyltransferase [Corynebacterium sp. CNJ-954]OLT54314.1 hypothetical protein BJF89_16930 [Corynebacterium sp. CNJ-954]
MTDWHDTGDGPNTDNYLDYLLTNRTFTAGAVAAAVASLGPAVERCAAGRPVRVLDAGTGAGGALPELDSLCDTRDHGGTVLAVDIDRAAVDLAREVAEGSEHVDVRVGDVRDIAAVAAATGQTYDLIWSSDVIWPGTFDEPADIVDAFSRILAPGGVLALFTTNYYQSMLLPGHTRLERLIRTASEKTWGLPDDGPHQYERLGAWMRLAGLQDITPTSFPLIALSTDPSARDYLETIVWPEMRHAASANGRAAGMSDDDFSRVDELLDPYSPQWIGADPDAFVLQPTVLWTGRAE